MRTAGDLARTLERIDGQGYKRYREIEGGWSFSELALFVDRVQADPFAAPSKLRVRIDLATTALPDSVTTSASRTRAAASWLARAFRDAIAGAGSKRVGSGRGGLISIDAGGPEVLERTAVIFGADFVEARIEVGLPAAGRRALGREAARLLVETLPEIATRAWIDRSDEDDASLVHFVDCIENQESVRARLAERDLIAFVGHGAILPRDSGASEEPMPAEQALPFESPERFAVEFEVPCADAGMPGRTWHGMGIPRGVVLLIGGGYHGKSTLLRAVERAVVPHVPGDGRETVVADPMLVKVRAEEGRAVTRVDIQPYIDRLPIAPGETERRDTSRFSTADASGSTSQAANLAEAIEAGATGLLLDEDTCATNFMVRDARMQALVHPDDEPITPLRDHVRPLFETLGVSSLIVMGGSGDFFDRADFVIELASYRPRDVSDRAHEIARTSVQAGNHIASRSPRIALRAPRPRRLLREGFDSRRGRKDVKFSTRGCEEIVYGTTEIDLRGVEQIFDPSQTRAIAGAIHWAAADFADDETTLREILDLIDARLDRDGLDGLDPFHRPERHPGALARPRRFEIAAAINRMRSLRVD